jgi:hypothetical protein
MSPASPGHPRGTGGSAETATKSHILPARCLHPFSGTGVGVEADASLDMETSFSFQRPLNLSCLIQSSGPAGIPVLECPKFF